MSRHCGSGDGWCGAERLEGRVGLREGSGEVWGVGYGWVGDGDGDGVESGAGTGGCGGRGGGGGGWGGGFDYPHSGQELVSVWIDGQERMTVPMGLCSNEFCDCVSESGLRIYVEDGVGVLAVNHAAGGKDDGDEMDTSVFE